MINQLPTKTFKTGRVVVDWKKVEKGFTVEIKGQIFKVVSNENVDKVSKTTGKAYKQRRLVITDGNELVTLEIGTESFKKGSFVKRFNKLLKDVKPIVKEQPKEVVKIVIDLAEEKAKAEETDDNKAFIMTDSEQVDYHNRLYKALMEHGLIQAYTDWERGKFVDKSTMEKLEQVLDEVDGIDLDEVQRMLDEENGIFKEIGA